MYTKHRITAQASTLTIYRIYMIWHQQYTTNHPIFDNEHLKIISESTCYY